jgi:UDP-N-acetyl-D-mannosaminuronic acid dehydrogenase
VVVLCVGTPIQTGTREPRLDYLRTAVAELAPRIVDDTVFIVRSTVPVGTTRAMVLSPLSERVSSPLVAFCPERTIQGQALTELRTLPQVVGGHAEARRRAAELFRRLTPHVVEVSSLEAAELVKLVNNAHTDLIYGFGNEVALIAGAIGVDADEVIGAANVEYPRPDVSSPGYVGGSCLEKDPHMLIASARMHGYEPRMVAAARDLNERVPVHVAERVLAELEHRAVDPARATVMVSGIAYKGKPETDDVRGSAAPIVAGVLRPRVRRLLGHDFVVADETIAGFGLEPSGLVSGCAEANALIVLNNHAGYADLTLPRLMSLLSAPRVLYDLWGVFKSVHTAASHDGVYLRLANDAAS